jgi:bacterioferritin (cytochrome b1)
MPAKVDFSILTLMDTLDLATLIEVEAFKRYNLFVEQIGSSTEAGAFFQSMADNEKKHAEQLAERRVALFGDTPATVKLGAVRGVAGRGGRARSHGRGYPRKAAAVV